MRFRIDGREYAGASALEIVSAMRRDAAHGVPACELDVSNRLDEETLALGYLFLCDEYGVGELIDAPRGVKARPASRPR